MHGILVQRGTERDAVDRKREVGRSDTLGKEPREFMHLGCTRVAGREVADRFGRGFSHRIVADGESSRLPAKAQTAEGGRGEPLGDVVDELRPVHSRGQFRRPFEAALKAAAGESRLQRSAVRGYPSAASRQGSFEVQNERARRIEDKS